jgi:hypothetical protein
MMHPIEDLDARVTGEIGQCYLVKKSVGDIKPGDYIASTGIKGTDGKLHAIEVRIFPESLRGAGEGHCRSAWPNTAPSAST